MANLIKNIILVNLCVFRQFNLTIKATNMASVSSSHNIIVHILDVNDNHPIFMQTDYYGHISEASEPGTYVYCNDSQNRYILIYFKNKFWVCGCFLLFVIIKKIIYIAFSIKFLKCF